MNSFLVVLLFADKTRTNELPEPEKSLGGKRQGDPRTEGSPEMGGEATQDVASKKKRVDQTPVIIAVEGAATVLVNGVVEGARVVVIAVEALVYKP